jgi:hypothetical protein
LNSILVYSVFFVDFLSIGVVYAGIITPLVEDLQLGILWTTGENFFSDENP